MATDILTDDELLAKLRAKYERTVPGNCPHCGTPVVVEDHPGGYPLPWACPRAIEELKAARDAGVSDEALAPILEHWQVSRWEDYRRQGDRRVMELIARYEALKSR
jgi:hypothetical protein